MLPTWLSSTTPPPPPSLQSVAGVKPLSTPPRLVRGEGRNIHRIWQIQRRRCRHLLKKKKTSPTTPPASYRHLDGLTKIVADERPVSWQSTGTHSLQERHRQEDLGVKSRSAPSPPWLVGRIRSPLQIHPPRWSGTSALLRELVVLLSIFGSDRRSRRRLEKNPTWPHILPERSAAPLSPLPASRQTTA
jgi:hypothetical protein